MRYQGETSSASETVFREAPAAPKASNQLKLMQYAKKTPGRLASRLLLKMQAEGAQGAVGANPAEQGEMTPPAAVHYFHTMMVPQLGTRLGMRAHREMRALCTALDLLAPKVARARSRSPGPAPESNREELPRRALASSAVPGASRSRRRRAAEERRRGVHEPGTSPRPEAKEGKKRGRRRIESAKAFRAAFTGA